MKNLRIVFMGTPDFAVPSLQVLVENGYQVLAVITAPDKPQGRGQRVTASPVKQYALDQGIRVLQPTNLKSPEFLEELKNLQANLQVVVAFRMLPEAVWSMPSLGTFNLHASLLPQYRGAAPINWAIINGEKETGITTFFLRQEIDTGNIIFQESEPIREEDNAGSLYLRLMHKGSRLVLKTIRAIEEGPVTTSPQQIKGVLHPAPKIFRENCEINWNQSVSPVRNFVRGLSPHPGAWATIGGKVYKIFRVSENTEVTGTEPWVTDRKTYFCMKCADGYVSIDEWQPEGKKRMNIRDFFLGNTID